MVKNFRENKSCLPAVAVIVVLLVSLIGLFGLRTPGYMVYVDGNQEFALKHKADLQEVLNKIEVREETNCQYKLELATKVECKRGLVRKSQLVSCKEAEKKLVQVLDFKVPACAIVVDGKKIAYVESKAAANSMLNRLKKEYSQLEAGEKLVAIDFAEKVKVKEEKVPFKKLVSIEEAYDLIRTGTNNPEKYIVKEGDNLWLIARRNDMYVDDIVQANGLTTENLQLDQELILVKSKPYINVITKVEGEKTEVIPYETKVIVDKNSPGSIRVKQEGKNGERHIAYTANKRNGITEKTNIIEEKILKAAVDKVVIKGTRVTQIASRGGGGSGALDWPTYGRITQYYRSGHRAIDIGGRTGQAIRAADSGYVSFAGYQGSYGKLVIVNHNNGIVTKYAHCSSINVSTGQKVSKGQTIAALGSTGRSSGPHLHFEVLVNGSATNPLNYLR
ncbi:MAG TPA: peptidoglycan DD-metalloendopeptidase family protein [Gelria sp.]|jgi:murein DD-endopeptidase MepM/ murein hydrolase activator NlpD|nr:peptidoglycan DD-metalloendopeptidase family protein [Gelria sp.]